MSEKALKPTSDENIGNQWTDDQRRTAWTLICKSRIGLKLELSPIIATAFIILQNYFRCVGSTPYQLFILMNAALFTSCKASNCHRPIEMVYNELNRICRSAPSNMIRDLVGCNVEQNVDPGQIELVTQAELDLLQSVDFDMNFELPFTHFEKIKDTLQSKFLPDVFLRICNNSIVNICLVICSKLYLDIPPEVTAAASTKEALSKFEIPESVDIWFTSVLDKYGSASFDMALEQIILEKSKTFQRSPPSPPPAQPL